MLLPLALYSSGMRVRAAQQLACGHQLFFPCPTLSLVALCAWSLRRHWTSRRTRGPSKARSSPHTRPPERPQHRLNGVFSHKRRASERAHPPLMPHSVCARPGGISEPLVDLPIAACGNSADSTLFVVIPAASC